MKNKNGRRRRNKAARKEASAGNGEGDRLSKLPNDLLLNILERVDTLDAIRVCVLSKQMLKLPTMLSQFFLSFDSIPAYHDKARVSSLSLSDVFRTNSAVAHVTDNILTTRSPEITISKLKIRFILMQPDSLTIGKSVASAMATQKVDAAEFEIVTEKPYKICSSADLLHHGKQFNDFVCACPNAFAGLRRLWLRNMRFGALDIPNILTTCKLLESLRLTHCDSGIHSVLQVEHAQLVELLVDYGQFERVELICLPKLKHVAYTNWSSCEDPMYFGFVPQLSKLSLTKIGVRSEKNIELSQLLANVPSISELHLDFRSEKIWIIPECPKLLAPVLSKLQHVNLDHLPEGCDLAWTMFILEAAPSLKELCITVWDHWCIIFTDKEFRKENGFCNKADVKWKPYAPNFKHKNLVKLTIYGFQPDDNFVRYIRCVVEAAVNVAEISLYDRVVCGRCGDLDPEIKDKVCPSRYPWTAEERTQATEDLGLPSRAAVHFRS
ncbi:hypothetical protein CFC21_071336 [Triticum aestivum]|uniref:F-box domain-containing protein n=3 Tax=Triticum TaxID=4564 RepID=A0A9R1AL08_TRITD|nr:uncharacterized protein LOC123111715 [Triticum aestivum]KAF7065192.1 hypothetical protein CFC21_071336 [Triticum aestivum]VAI31599.1 unnamed protein product [Triticum turgidum subsp. durum]